MVRENYAKYQPHSAGCYAAKHSSKARCFFVEHLTNSSMMMHGHSNGRELLTVDIVRHSFEIIHLVTGEKPSRSW